MTLIEDLQGAIQGALAKAGPSVVGIGRHQRGSGVVVADGRVLTNAHNLRGDEVTVTFADGRDLASAVRLLADWGGRRPVDGEGAHEALRHEACGTPLEARWFCPTCERTIADGETADDRLI